MTKRMSDDERMEARDRARGRADDKFLSRDEVLRRKAEPLVGELCREGVTLFYVNIRDRAGRLTGKIKEFTGALAEQNAISYLVRNHYV